MCRMYFVDAEGLTDDMELSVFVAANSPTEAAEMAHISWDQMGWEIDPDAENIRVVAIPTPVRMGVIDWADLEAVTTLVPIKENA